MLMVLALIWGAFLVWWLRSRAQGTFGDSVGTFRRHLRVLERAAPTTVRPANRLRGPQMVPAYRPPAGIQGVPSRSGGGNYRPVASNDLRRRQAVKRRRDVLFLLAIAVIATLLMAVATQSKTIVVLQVMTDAVLAAYVALLVRMRTLAAERDMKLTYISRERPGRSYAYDRSDEAYAAAVASQGAARRRPQPSYARSGYAGAGFGSYGELAMGRAAN